ncbi:MAG: hypothetical protein KatS3mg031_2963 [Chitinophagales bacterium]|nr:MAG: hypothetical protein KatS3mg031_2963 [Chitinophagales bacterium]
MGQRKEVIDKFVIDVLLIEPINKILSKLQSGEYRDCDVEWLDGQVLKFTKIAAEVFNVTLNGNNNSGNKVLNEHTKKDYEKKFTTLLNFFKQCKN